MIIYVYMCMYIFLTTVQGANGGFVEFFIDTLALILEEHRLYIQQQSCLPGVEKQMSFQFLNTLEPGPREECFNPRFNTQRSIFSL